ncbi:MAG: DUF1573 domain-containing protein [Saprospiraceae bacterium]
MAPQKAWVNPADALIELHPPDYNFGEVNEGQFVEVAFTLRNIGDEILEIEIISACECIEAHWTTGKIQPDAQAEIKLLFDTRGRKGLNEKDIDLIFVNTDAEGYPLVKRARLVGLVK